MNIYYLGYMRAKIIIVLPILPFSFPISLGGLNFVDLDGNLYSFSFSILLVFICTKQMKS